MRSQPGRSGGGVSQSPPSFSKSDSWNSVSLLLSQYPLLVGLAWSHQISVVTKFGTEQTDDARNRRSATSMHAEDEHTLASTPGASRSRR